MPWTLGRRAFLKLTGAFTATGFIAPSRPAIATNEIILVDGWVLKRSDLALEMPNAPIIPLRDVI